MSLDRKNPNTEPSVSFSQGSCMFYVFPRGLGQARPKLTALFRGLIKNHLNFCLFAFSSISSNGTFYFFTERGEVNTRLLKLKATWPVYTFTRIQTLPKAEGSTLVFFGSVKRLSFFTEPKGTPLFFPCFKVRKQFFKCF